MFVLQWTGLIMINHRELKQNGSKISIEYCVVLRIKIFQSLGTNFKCIFRLLTYVYIHLTTMFIIFILPIHYACMQLLLDYCPACRTSLIATRFWVVMICPIIKCLTVLEFSLILFDLCLFITIFNFILNYVPIVTFWIFTYHKIWILLIIFCFIWSYWIIYFLTCLEVFWSVVS